MNTMELAQWIGGLYFQCFYYVLWFEEVKKYRIIELGGKKI